MGQHFLLVDSPNLTPVAAQQQMLRRNNKIDTCTTGHKRQTQSGTPEASRLD